MNLQDLILVFVVFIFTFAITRVFMLSLEKNVGNNNIMDAIYWSLIAIITALYLHKQDILKKVF